MEPALELPKLVAPGEPVRRVEREVESGSRGCTSTLRPAGAFGDPTSLPWTSQKGRGGNPRPKARSAALWVQGSLNTDTPLSHLRRGVPGNARRPAPRPYALWPQSTQPAPVARAAPLAPPAALGSPGPQVSDLPVLREAVQKQHEGPVATSSRDIVEAQARALGEGTV